MEKILIVSVVVALLFCVCGDNDSGTNPQVKPKTFTDERDGQTYRYVTIGTQTWMAGNLNYRASGSKCYGEDGEVVIGYDEEKPYITITKTLSDKEVQDNCAKYGRLYNCNDAKTACPSGWHLPSDEEWTTLENYVGGRKTAGTKLKSKTGWNWDEYVDTSISGNGTDDFGFSALPGGVGFSDGNFNRAGNCGYWWSATEYDANHAWSRNINYDGEDVYRGYVNNTIYFSVRCLLGG